MNDKIIWSDRYRRGQELAASADGSTERMKEAVSEAIREALGGALDCGRVWSAWGVGTMSEDDFSPVADDAERVAEIADAVLDALAATGKQQVGEEMSVEEDVYCSIADMIEPYVQREGTNPDGPLPASVHDSVQIIFDHWLKTRAQAGEVQGDALVGDEMVQAFKAALSRAQLPGKPRTYFLKDSELPSILREVLAARQPGAEEPVSPMAKMAAALREKAAIEHTEYSQRVQSGEWGPMPEAATQADFCRYCEGSGWGGESRKTKCPACSGTGMPVPPAQGIDLGQLWEPIKEAVHTALSVHVSSMSQKKREQVAVYVARQLRDGQRDAAPEAGS